MSVMTIVHRAFAAGLPWKRRLSTDKGKGKETDTDVSSSGRDSLEHIHFGTHNADIPGPTLQPLHSHCDVSPGLHVAVKPGLDHTTRPEDSPDYPDGPESFEADSDAESQVEHETRFPPHCSSSSTRASLAHVVRWASIVRSRCRWTKEQERELLMAEKQLARCQKAWSSEQELWLAYIETLSEEKEAHEGFMLMRTRQQEDEQNQFRKAWKRRRSLETARSTKESHVVTRSDNNRFMKLRRLQRYGQWASTLAAAEGTALTCQG